MRLLAEWEVIVKMSKSARIYAMLAVWVTFSTPLALFSLPQLLPNESVSMQTGLGPIWTGIEPRQISSVSGIEQNVDLRQLVRDLQKENLNLKKRLGQLSVSKSCEQL